MRKMSKLWLLSFLLIFLITFSIASVSNVYLCKAQGSGTNVPSYIISQDTTWNLAGSPYTLTGPVGVATGVTLTIDAGVTVNIGTYCLTVNGTLMAQGTNNNPIYINAVSSVYASLVLNAIDSSNETGSGGIIENAIISTIGLQVYGGSPQFENDVISGIEIFGSAPLISDNTINGSVFINGYDSPVISGNLITGVISVQGGSPIISGNTITTSNTYGAAFQGEGNSKIYYGVQIASTTGIPASATISNNSIATGIYGGSDILDNSVAGGIILTGGSGTISGNTIEGGTNGIVVPSGGGNCVIENNIISGSTVGILTTENGNIFNEINNVLPVETNLFIENNLITNNQYGMQIQYNNVVFQNNTVSNNSVGLYQPPTNFSYNNIENNTQNSVYLQSGGDINASYNWWGTIDQQAINQTIHDSKDNYNLGTVTFVPFLTAPNTQAMPDLTAPLPTSIALPTPQPTPQPTTSPSYTYYTPSPSPQSPSATPNQVVTQTKNQLSLNWTQIALLTSIGIIIALVIAVLVLARKRKVNSPAPG